MRSLLKYRIKKLVPIFFWEVMSRAMKSKRIEQFKETKISFGPRNPEIKILIIRRRPPAAGLFSNVYHVLQGIIYASEENMIPVVDMKNYSTEYSVFRKFNGTNDAWRYFFEPISDIELGEAYKSKDVTMSRGDRILCKEDFGGRNLDFANNTESVKSLKHVYHKHIKLNNMMKDYMNYIAQEYEIENEGTLGIFLRGTDYITHPAAGHAKQPKINDVIRDVDEYLNTNAISRIFLSTDDSKFRSIFHDRYHDQMYPNIRIDNSSSFSVQTREFFKIPNFALARSISYLSEVYFLSQFDFNIASLSNGSAILQLINEKKFKKNIIYNLGYH